MGRNWERGKVSRSRFLTILGLLLFCVVVVTPPLLYGYIYPNGSDDTAAAYLSTIDSIKNGQPLKEFFIVSHAVVDYPIAMTSNITGWSVDTIFLWFVYGMLALSGIVIYFVMSRLVNRKAGWLALLLSVFCAQGLLFQFHWGQTFNFINIGIILPILLYFVVKYLTQGKAYQLAIALLLGILFGSFHMTGVYLPATAGFLVVAYVLYCLVKRKRLEIRPLLLGISIVLLSTFVFLKSGMAMVKATPSIATEQMGSGLGIPISSYLMNFVSPTILMALVFLALYYKEALRSLTVEAKVVCVVLGGLVIVLAVPAFTGFSIDSFRQGLDLATVMALLVAVSVASLAWSGKNSKVALVLLLMVGFGLFRSLPVWFSNTNAIQQVDKEAIAYINTLDYDSFGCSAEVAPLVYGRFLTANYEKGDGTPILIDRNVPMTPKSDSRTKWYLGHGVEPDDNYELLRTFDKDGIVVDVYRNIECER